MMSLSWVLVVIALLLLPFVLTIPLIQHDTLAKPRAIGGAHATEGDDWDCVPVGDPAVCSFLGGTCSAGCAPTWWNSPFLCDVGDCCMEATSDAWDDLGLCGLSRYINPAGIEHMSALLKNTPQIVGGSEARPNELPWQVALFEDGVLECGGILIDNDWVLTAAHCVSDSNSEFMVALGEHDTTTTSGDEIFLSIDGASVHIHPRYEPLLNVNDIALLQLPRHVPFHENIGPACRPHIDLNDDEKLLQYAGTVSGWGMTGYNQPRATVLRYANVELISHHVCAELYTGVGVVRSTQICAGDVANGGVDACSGDSGGPLVVKYEGRFNLIGIVSWGYGCGEPGFPGIYTRVSEFLDWIDTVKKGAPWESGERSESWESWESLERLKSLESLEILNSLERLNSLENAESFDTAESLENAEQ